MFTRPPFTIYVENNACHYSLLFSNTFVVRRKGKISSKVVTSDGTKEHEEVFYTIPLQGRRRHSVGGYLATGSAGTGEVTAVPSEVPKMPPPRFNQTNEETITRRRPKNFQFKG